MDDQERHFIGDLLADSGTADEEIDDDVFGAQVTGPPPGISSKPRAVTLPTQQQQQQHVKYWTQTGAEPPPPYSPPSADQQTYWTYANQPAQYHPQAIQQHTMYAANNPNATRHLSFIQDNQMQPLYRPPPAHSYMNVYPPHLLHANNISTESVPYGLTRPPPPSAYVQQQYGLTAQDVQQQWAQHTVPPDPPQQQQHHNIVHTVPTNLHNFESGIAQPSRPEQLNIQKQQQQQQQQQPVFAPHASNAPVATVLPQGGKSYSAVARAKAKVTTPIGIAAKITHETAPRKTSLPSEQQQQADEWKTLSTSDSPELVRNKNTTKAIINNTATTTSSATAATKKSTTATTDASNKNKRATINSNSGAHFTAQLIDDDDDVVPPTARSRFQVLADWTSRPTSDDRSSTPPLDDGKSQRNSNTANVNNTNKARTGDGNNKLNTANAAQQRRTKRHRGGYRETGRHSDVFLIVAHYLRVLAFTIWDIAVMFLVWLRNLVVELTSATFDISIYYGRKYCTQFYDSVHSITLRCVSRMRYLCSTSSSSSPLNNSTKTTNQMTLGARVCRSFVYIITFEWLRKSKSTDTGYSDDSFGVSENIQLPTSGDEAIARLITCAPQRDAYSILGLRHDCSDEEIRRYYRRQAVLVHPDKNNSHGAAEAFKILAAAFELINSEDKRIAYDQQNLHRTAEMKQLNELMQQLRAKMQEALSTMHCGCGVRHRRYPVASRTQQLARYCQKCREYHSAKDDDIWAESRWIGFLWYYYACIHGQVYDITEWAGCKHNLLKHMKANSHLVQYRLMSPRASGAGAGGGGTATNTSGRPQGGHSSSSGAVDPNMDELLSRFANAMKETLNTNTNINNNNLRRTSSPATTTTTNNVSQKTQQQQQTTTTSGKGEQATYRPPERDDERPTRAATRRRKK